MSFVLRTVLTGLRDLIYPPNCLICKEYIHPNTQRLNNRFSDGLLCQKCLSVVQLNFPPFCPKCSRHLGKLPTLAKCNECRKSKPNFDFAWGACIFDDYLKKLIHDFKYNQKTLLRHPLGELIIRFVDKYYLDIHQFDLVMPIPLSTTRHRERGYNQAHLLAVAITQEYSLNLSIHNLTRIRHTKNQSLLSRKERWTNITGAFRINNPISINNQSILLIDDLLTTGATASEAALTLKQCGAKTVGVLTLAIVT